jgi:hypothetical protein
VKNSMNRTYLMISLLLAGLLPAALPAQDNVVYSPPAPPLVASVPENAAWILSVSDGKAQSPTTPNQRMGVGAPQSAAKNPGLREIRVTKTGNLKRDIVSYGNGTTVEVWYVDGVLFTPDSNQQLTVFNYKAVQAQYGNGLGNAIVSAGFTGLDWLDLKDYDQVVFYQGQPCYHYGIKVQQRQLLPKGTPPTAPPLLSAEAWINAKTALPVAYTDGDGKVYTYRFLDSPAAPLALPPAYHVALTSYEKEQDKMKRLEEASAALRRP